jgi:hypothetical protein
MDPRAEAFARLGGRYEVRVLEPSPPAVTEPPWFADDPAVRGDAPPGRPVVTPVSGGDVTWDELCLEAPDLARWCAERWLAAWPLLGAPPPGLAEARVRLHRLAAEVVSPERERATGKIGLRWTRGGFGTPYFGDDRQVRVEEGWLVRTGPEGTAREAIDVEDGSARWIGELFGLATSALEELRATARPAQAPARVQLWPEHFDLALEIGDEAAGARATVGVSPGDAAHPEPYAYVAPWQAPSPGPAWNASSFAGAELPWAELAEAPDQRGMIIAFARERLDALAGATSAGA